MNAPSPRRRARASARAILSRFRILLPAVVVSSLLAHELTSDLDERACEGAARTATTAETTGPSERTAGDCFVSVRLGKGRSSLAVRGP